MRVKFDATRTVVLSAALSLSACSTGSVQPSIDTPRRAEAGEVVEALPAASVAVGRKLMIIGNIDGKLVGNNSRDAIFTDRLAEDVGGAQHLRVLVVPAASGAPAFLGGYLRSLFASRGVSAAQIEVAQIANKDDLSTPSVDESTWANGAYDAAEISKVARANVIWFAGGNQNRLTSLLMTGQGNDTPFLAAVREKLEAQALIVVGYSAGAAALSDPMIGNGTSFGALSLAPSTDPNCAEANPICVAPGLGFVQASDSVIIDQHFEERGRVARLVRALALADKHTGWGVSVNGALYVDLAKRTAEVVGNPGDATVTIVGREGAAQNREQPGPPFLGDGYTVSVLGTGDVYALPNPEQRHGVASHLEASEVYQPFSSSFDAPSVLTDAFGHHVLTKKVSQLFADSSPHASGARVDAIALDTDEQDNATGFRLRFTADANSRVAKSEDAGYSIFGARLQFTALEGKFTDLGS